MCNWFFVAYFIIDFQPIFSAYFLNLSWIAHLDSNLVLQYTYSPSLMPSWNLTRQFSVTSCISLVKVLDRSECSWHHLITSLYFQREFTDSLLLSYDCPTCFMWILKAFKNCFSSSLRWYQSLADGNKFQEISCSFLTSKIY